MSKRLYHVTIPVAGHAHLAVEAESEQEAIDLAFGEAEERNIDGWEFLAAFHQGNVCFCPSPWKATAEPEDEE